MPIRIRVAGVHGGAERDILVRGQAGERRIAAKDFFTGIYETALSAQELLIAVELPAAQKNSVHFFHEFARRHGDYAIVGHRRRRPWKAMFRRPSACLLCRRRSAGIGGAATKMVDRHHAFGISGRVDGIE